MKKTLSILLCAILLLASVSCLLASADNCGLGKHRYSTKWQVLKEANCVEMGVMYIQCEFCHDMQYKDVPIDPDNHKDHHAPESAVYNTEKPGTHTAVCAHCKKSYEQECYGIPMEKKEPDGKCRYTHQCLGCNNVSGDCRFAYVSNNDGHQTHKMVCVYCEKTDNENCVPSEPFDVEPTCTQAGAKVTQCLKCKDIKIVQLGAAALGHIDEDGDGRCDREACGEPMPVKEEPTQEPEEKAPSFIDKIKAFFASIIEWLQKLFKTDSKA